MKNKITESFLDSFKSVIPITMIVLIISLFLDVSKTSIIAFLISSVFLVFGISFFTIGANMSMIEIGEHIGSSIIKKRRLLLILIISFIVGMFITISEPDLTVFAKEITSIPSLLIIFLSAIGIGIYLMVGVFRIIKKISYRTIVTISLLLIMLLLYFVPLDFVSIAFDGGSVTTGAMGVPMIIAFGYGITKYRSDKEAKGDSFGLCGLASLGPVIAILILGLFFKVDSHFDTSSFINNSSLLNRFISHLSSSLKDVLICVLPIIGVFLVSQIIDHNLSKNKIIKISIGIIISIIGLTLFLTGVSTGFIEMGYHIGSIFASNTYRYFLIPIGMILGYIIINVEPSVKILNKSIAELTEGSISERMINLCISIGVCLAIGISLCRIFFDIPMVYVVVPGYFIAGLLMYFTPKMFMTIAFDSGGAASGTMTTSFLLPLCIGACEISGGNILADAFGVGALVALAPIITIQIVGIMYDYKLKIKDNYLFDEEIIDYAWEE